MLLYRSHGCRSDAVIVCIASLQAAQVLQSSSQRGWVVCETPLTPHVWLARGVRRAQYSKLNAAVSSLRGRWPLLPGVHAWSACSATNDRTPGSLGGRLMSPSLASRPVIMHSPLRGVTHPPRCAPAPLPPPPLPGAPVCGSAWCVHHMCLAQCTGRHVWMRASTHPQVKW